MAKFYLLICLVFFYLSKHQVMGNYGASSIPHHRKTVEEFMRKNGLSSPEECSRTCEVSEKKRCYYNFFLEQYSTQTRACDYCLPNRTNNCQCIVADGVVRSVTTANRMIPGPSIEVCEGDEVIVDVENHLEGSDVTIHWHGLHQNGSQFYDGVPFVTQCPILQGNKFRYIWIANDYGSHYWHAHTGFQKMDGLSGSVIVRQVLSKDRHGKLYDHDLSQHVIFVQDWIHELAGNRYPGCRYADNEQMPRCASVSQIPDNILINGKGQFNGSAVAYNATLLETFRVEQGKKYRFRLIGAISLACPAEIVVENHTLTVIASDGKPVKPLQVKGIVFTSGERYDFIVHAKHEPRKYKMDIRAVGLCANLGIRQLAILEYASHNSTAPKSISTNDQVTQKMLNSAVTNCGNLDTTICLAQLQNAQKMDARILKPQPDLKLFLPFSLYSYEDEELFHPNQFNNYFAPLGVDHMAGLVNNISYAPTPSPLLSQFSELDTGKFCNNAHSDIKCNGICRCTHIVKIPLHSMVELILIDEMAEPDLAHPFHLHGHSFYVMERGQLPNLNETISLQRVAEMDKQGQLYKLNEFAPSKDTIAVPNNGYIVVRFIANNPGFWMFHCHFLNHLLTGMSLVLQVGNVSDFPVPPKNFPKCGDYAPDI